MPEVAAGFSQTPDELRSECVTTMLGLMAIRNELIKTGHEANFEVRLFSEAPRARFYMFDEGRPDGLTFFIPHLNGINTPNLPGLLFNNSKSSLANMYKPSVEGLWKRSVSFAEWLAAHPGAFRN